MSEAAKAKIRETRYTAAAVITVAGPLLAAALAEGGVSKWVAVVIAVAGVLTGGAGTAVAAAKTRAQRKDGVFDPAPEPPSPLDLVVENLPVVAQAVAQAQAVVESTQADLDRVRQVAVDALGPLAPVVDTVRNVTIQAGLSAVEQAIAKARAGAPDQ
jgi:hypothetical protein